MRWKEFNLAQNNQSNASGSPLEPDLERCVREMLSDMRQLGIGDETREVSGADAVDLLNHYLPQLRRTVSGMHR